MPSGIQRFSRDLVLEAATAVIRRDGLEAISMRKIAADLDTGPMSLYAYFKTKEELLDAVADAGLERIELRIDPSAGWKDQLISAFTSLETGLDEQPEVRELLASRSVHGPAVDDLRETVIGILRGAGFTPAESLHVLATIYSFTLGYLATAHRAGNEPGEFSDLDGERHPNLLEAVNDYSNRTGLSVFADGLRHLVDGFERERGNPR